MVSSSLRSVLRWLGPSSPAGPLAAGAASGVLFAGGAFAVAFVVLAWLAS